MKVVLSLEIDEDQWMGMTIELPFPPLVGMTINVTGLNDGSDTIFDSVEIELAEYYVREDVWDCFVKMEFGVYEDSPLLLDELLRRGWKQK